MSTKEQTLSWLAELPEDSPAWRELHDDARLLRDIAVAEDDVRNGRERPPGGGPGTAGTQMGSTSYQVRLTDSALLNFGLIVNDHA